MLYGVPLLFSYFFRSLMHTGLESGGDRAARGDELACFSRLRFGHEYIRAESLWVYW